MKHLAFPSILTSIFVSIFPHDSLVASDGDPEPVELKTVLYASHECEHPSARPEDSATGVITIPSDAAYRYDGTTTKITTQNSRNTGFDAPVYDPAKKQVRFRVWAKNHSDCIQFAGWHGPNAWLGVEFTVKLTKNACDHPPPAPADGLTLNDAIAAYEKTAEAVNCSLALAQRRRAVIVSDFEKKILRKGEERKGSVQVDIAKKRAEVFEIGVIIQNYVEAIHRFEDIYSKLVKSFESEGRTRAESRTSSLVKMLEMAKGSNLAQLARISVDVNHLQNEEAEDQSVTLVAAKRLSGDLDFIEQDYSAKFESHIAFANTNSIARPELTGELKKSIQSIIETLEARAVEFFKVLHNANLAIELRKSSLIQLNADQQTREALSAAKNLEASAKFVEDINRLSQAAWTPQLRNDRLHLPYLENDYLAKRRFQSLSFACSGSAADWMVTGCGVVENEIVKVSVYLQSSLLRKIRDSIRVLNAQPSPSARIPELEKALSENRILEAVHLHDLLLDEVKP